MERKLKENLADIRNSKDDNSVKHTVSEAKLKFGDVSNKIEVKVPELQMSFYVKKDTPKEEIDRKINQYLNRSGILLGFKTGEE